MIKNILNSSSEIFDDYRTFVDNDRIKEVINNTEQEGINKVVDVLNLIETKVIIKIVYNSVIDYPKIELLLIRN